MEFRPKLVTQLRIYYFRANIIDNDNNKRNKNRQRASRSSSNTRFSKPNNFEAV